MNTVPRRKNFCAAAVGSLAAATALWAAVVTTAATASADPDTEFIERVKSLGLEVGPEDEKYVLQIAHSVCVLLDAKGSADEIAAAMTDEGATTEQAQGSSTPRRRIIAPSPSGCSELRPGRPRR